MPLSFSQGFNPHPIVSLACARPVGVATDDDLVVLKLAEPMDGEDLARRMTLRAPSGMTFARPVLLESKRSPRPRLMRYELALDARQDCDALDRRLTQLEAMASWPIERIKPPARRGRPPGRRTVDLRGLIEKIARDDRRLLWTAHPQGDLWARTDEVLCLVGLDAPGTCARVVRKNIDYDWPDAQATAVKRKETDG